MREMRKKYSVLVNGEWSGWNSTNKDCKFENDRWLKPAIRWCNSPPALFGGEPCRGENSTKLECHSSKSV